MDPQPAFTFQDFFSFVIRDMAEAVSGRPGELQAQRFARTQAAVHMILGLRPRDVIEAMLAGHCVMLHEAMTANVRNSLRGEADPTRRGPRSNVVGLNKAFNDNLDRLQRYRQRTAEGSRDAPETAPVETAKSAANVSRPPDDGGSPVQMMEATEFRQPRAEMPKLNRAARRQAARAETRAAVAASRAAPKTSVVAQQPAGQNSPGDAGPPAHSADAIARYGVSPEAMTALHSGDPIGFAHALGIEHPSEAFLKAANTKGSPFDPEASGPWQSGAIAPAAKS